MRRITSLTPIKIWGKCYNLQELQKIGQGKIDDDLLEWVGQNLDYISDCDQVRFHEVYRWTYRNKQTGKEVDVYVNYYPDKDTIAFSGYSKKDFIYYRK